jgi:hypothetical protein
MMAEKRTWMDPLSLAAAAVALLAPYLQQAGGVLADRAGEAIADASLAKVRALYEQVRAKLRPGSYQGALLDGVQEAPEDVGRQEILKAELAKVISQDQTFAAELERLVNEAEVAGGVQIAASDAGMMAGGDVHQWAGGDVVGRDKIGGDHVGGNKISYAPPPQPER